MQDNSRSERELKQIKALVKVPDLAETESLWGKKTRPDHASL